MHKRAFFLQLYLNFFCTFLILTLTFVHSHLVDGWEKLLHEVVEEKGRWEMHDRQRVFQVKYEILESCVMFSSLFNSAVHF